MTPKGKELLGKLRDGFKKVGSFRAINGIQYQPAAYDFANERNSVVYRPRARREPQTSGASFTNDEVGDRALIAAVRERLAQHGFLNEGNEDQELKAAMDPCRASRWTATRPTGSGSRS